VNSKVAPEPEVNVRFQPACDRIVADEFDVIISGSEFPRLYQLDKHTASIVRQKGEQNLQQDFDSYN
jgi:hypothetical protein